jgi:hypothetical protein
MTKPEHFEPPNNTHHSIPSVMSLQYQHHCNIINLSKKMRFSYFTSISVFRFLLHIKAGMRDGLTSPTHRKMPFRFPDIWVVNRLDNSYKKQKVHKIQNIKSKSNRVRCQQAPSIYSPTKFPIESEAVPTEVLKIPVNLFQKLVIQTAVLMLHQFSMICGS